MLQFQTEVLNLSFPRRRESRKLKLDPRRSLPSSGIGGEDDTVETTDHPILKILQQQSPDYESLMELSGLPPHEFAQALTELEIEGKVRKNSAGYFELG